MGDDVTLSFREAVAEAEELIRNPPFKIGEQDLAENMLPFTRIERNFSGNRYGEMRGRIPGYADYACQVTPSLPTRYRG